MKTLSVFLHFISIIFCIYSHYSNNDAVTLQILSCRCSLVSDEKEFQLTLQSLDLAQEDRSVPVPQARLRPGKPQLCSALPGQGRARVRVKPAEIGVALSIGFGTVGSAIQALEALARTS